MADYATRIPQAIEKAKGLVALGVDGKVWFSPDALEQTLTATEVALAKALWGYFWRTEEVGIENPPAALIAFCEKVEGLTTE